jgi:hypothetical protein
VTLGRIDQTMTIFGSGPNTPVNGSPDTTTFRKSVGSATDAGAVVQSPGANNSSGTTAINGNNAAAPQYVDSEQLRHTLKAINKRMERIETKLEYKNNYFDMAAKDMRVLLASLKSRPGEPDARPTGVVKDAESSGYLKHKYTLEGHNGPVNSLAVKDGLLYSGSDDNTIQVSGYGEISLAFYYHIW